MLQKTIELLTLVFFLVNVNVSGYYVNSKDVNSHNPSMVKSFVGTISENSNVVVLDSPLVAIDKDAPALPGLICQYRLHTNKGESSELPFTVAIIDKRSGTGEIRLKDGQKFLDCAQQKTYTLYVTAHDCGVGNDKDGNIIGQRNSRKSSLHISVVDINNHDPYFKILNNYFETEEPILPGKPIINVVAVDDDCSQNYGEICKYVLFGDGADVLNIDKNGVVTSMKLLKAVKESWINVSVIALDCDGQKSSPTLVSIKMLPPCAVGWSGINEFVDFIPSETHAVQIFSNPAVNLCMPSDDVVRVDISVRLDTGSVNAITGCDRDTYTLKDARRLCDTEEKEITELLPSFYQYKQLMEKTDLDFALPPTLRRDVVEHGVRIYEFNGIDQALEISNEEVYDDLIKLNLTSIYSISFRMLISQDPNETNQRKSTILCKSDKSSLSRHHFSIYTKNCHLVLLIRNEHGLKRSLNPAEWHWKLDDNDCNEKWYRILLNIDFPNATLLVNGKEHSPFLIADDYPLQGTRKPSKWVIGASWEGRLMEYVHHFNGKLSDLAIHHGSLEQLEILTCVDQCKEGLIYQHHGDGETDDRSIKQHTSQLHDSNFTLMITSNSLNDIFSDLQTIVYYNSRTFPTPGIRSVSIETSLECLPTAPKCSYIPPRETYIKVLPPSDPVITLSGSQLKSFPESDVLSRELYLFDDIKIVSEAKNNLKQGDIVQEQNLDRCLVLEVEGGNGSWGKFKAKKRNRLVQNGLILEKLKNGIAIRGIQKLEVYEQILRTVVYQNQQAKTINDVIFIISCSELNGRYQSNQFQLTLTVFHPSPQLIPAEIPPFQPRKEALSVALMASDVGAVRLNPAGAETPDNIDGNFMTNAEGSHYTTTTVSAIIIAVCVACLLILTVAAILYVRLHGYVTGIDEEEEDIVMNEHVVKEVQEEELDWDDSAMIITSNPMENEDFIDVSESDFSEIEDEIASQSSYCDNELQRQSTSRTTKYPIVAKRSGRLPDDFYEWKE
ncbi:calsyntenin-1-like isoform X1 [Clavelina lepadiformis]|uniref:calsyntenin-1-like isoform X1 n=1 Tax=Clavelina lepadiformis TaxID=159417 RepID=UPI004042E488